MSIATSLYSHTFFKNEVMTINGVRATDDALIFTVEDSRDPEWASKSKRKLEIFKSLFLAIMGNLTLEFDDYSDSYEFTENVVINTYCDIVVTYNNKNFESLVHNGTQKIIKGCHANSLTSHSIKINTISNTFLRIDKSTSFDAFTIEACLKYIYEIIVGFYMANLLD